MLGLLNVDGSTPPTTPWRSTHYESGMRVSPTEQLRMALSTYRIEQENVPDFGNAVLIESYDGCNTSSYRFDQSHIFNLNVSMPLLKFGGSDKWILTFGVRNLFGEKYFESARHYYECFMGEPRTFEIGIRATS